MTRGNEISTQPLVLFQDCVCCLLTVSVEMWLRLEWWRFSDTQTAARCSSEILLTASAHSLALCDCRGALHRWVCCLVCRQHLQIVEIASCVFFFFLMLHRIVSAKIWQQDIVVHTLMAECWQTLLLTPAPDAHMNESQDTHQEPARRWETIFKKSYEI